MFPRSFSLRSFFVAGLFVVSASAARAEGAEVHTVSRAVSAECKRLTVISPVKTIVRQGATPGVTLTGAPEDVARVEAIVEKDRVVIRNRGVLGRGPEHEVTAVVTLPALTELRAGQAANVRTEGLLTGQTLAVTVDSKSSVDLNAALDGELTSTVNGAGSLRLSGQCSRHICEATGAAKVDAAEMTATDAQVNLMGDGDVRVQATTTLAAKVNGTGYVRYAGNPTNVAERVGGGGALVKLQN